MISRSLILFALATCSLFAQGGDGGDKRMDPVVPEAKIPQSPFLPVADALKTFKLAPGFVIEAVVAEPVVEKPVCLDFDPAGRMWVCEMLGYMADVNGKDEATPSGRIVILEDTNHDGAVDKRTVFLDQILLPRAISVYEDGVLFIDQKRLCWVKRKGDVAEGEPQVLDTKLAKAGNVEHKANGLLSNLDNCLYLAKSSIRLRRSGDTWQQGLTATRGQWGIARDDYGHFFHSNNSTLLFGGQTYDPSADMPGLDMNPAITDNSLADIATYIRNEWGNSADPINEQKVKNQRAATKARVGRAWTAGELKH